VGASPAFIEPGSPGENGCEKSFNGKLRDELLNAEVFNTPAAAKVLSQEPFSEAMRPRERSEVSRP